MLNFYFHDNKKKDFVDFMKEINKNVIVKMFN